MTYELVRRHRQLLNHMADASADSTMHSSRYLLQQAQQAGNTASAGAASTWLVAAADLLSQLAERWGQAKKGVGLDTGWGMGPLAWVGGAEDTEANMRLHGGTAHNHKGAWAAGGTAGPEHAAAGGGAGWAGFGLGGGGKGGRPIPTFVAWRCRLTRGTWCEKFHSQVCGTCLCAPLQYCMHLTAC